MFLNNLILSLFLETVTSVILPLMSSTSSSDDSHKSITSRLKLVFCLTLVDKVVVAARQSTCLSSVVNWPIFTLTEE